ncbi:hypothetical protein ALC57_11984 [Trachymyrmex cornetzi]|uniref:DUF8207 domain-containing protein n=1 Tax=Trachymyrmex cornetzi TaxID=471704 RepID=A0A151J1L9_9HYME|nr:hypothetical protein ALC57_11984 [Trachymyrmex cornetzi]
MLLDGDIEKAIDHVYGVYLSENGTILGDKYFDVDMNDFVIVDGVKYKGTPDLYKLIFKRIPEDAIYTEDDKLAYKSILLATNADRCSHNADNPILGNKGYKYKNITAPLVSGKRVEKVIQRTMTLIDNKIDYVHWDDPNELVDLKELHASARENYPRRHVIVYGYDDLWQADVVEMRPYT